MEEVKGFPLIHAKTGSFRARNARCDFPLRCVISFSPQKQIAKKGIFPHPFSGEFSMQISTSLIVGMASCEFVLQPAREAAPVTHAQRNAEILKILEEQTKRNTVSRKVARAALIEEGIYTKKGKLRAEFGGKAAKEIVAA